MIRVKYEEYTNDFIRNHKTIIFYNLGEFENWVFNLCKGKWQDKISIPKPDRTDIWKDGSSGIDVNNMWEENKHYWIHQIERDSTIIYSDGKYTNWMKHWNDETKDMCRRMNERKMNPTFNFG